MFNFYVPIEKEVTRITKNEEEITRHLSYILWFIDSARFMDCSLSHLFNNLSKRIHRTKYNSNTMIKNVKNVKLNIVSIVAVF